jgi:hypothetical protein
VHCGLAILKSNGWLVVPGDKEAVFVLVEKPDLVKVALEFLGKPYYIETRKDADDLKLVRDEYCKVACMVEKVTGINGISDHLKSSLSMKGASLTANLRLLCKTTKGDGLVTFRNVHGGPPYLFSGLGAWVAHDLTRNLKGLYLLKDSRQYVKELKDRVFPDQINSTSLDVEEFYMSGEFDELIKDGLAHLDSSSPIRKVLERALWVLLPYQFVSCGLLPDRVWKMKRGAGMGLNFAGALADCCFRNKVERKWACMSNILKIHKILSYRQFHDDIHIIGGGTTDGTEDFARNLIKLAGYHSTKIEDRSEGSFGFL